MKRLIKIVLTLTIIFSFTSNIYGIDKGIERLDRDKQIYNNSESYQLSYNNQKARVFYGENGVDIIWENCSVHFDTNFAVSKLCVLADINNDGYNELATYQNSSTSDNLFIISSKDGQTISSYRFTREGFDETNGIIEVNTTISQMLAYNNNLIVVSDYDIYCLNDENCEVIFNYQDEDNIWDIEIIDDKLVFVDQLGEIGVIDINSGKLIHKEKIVEDYEYAYPYNQDLVITITPNLWDLYYFNNILYITSEDGYLYQYDCNDYSYEKTEIGLIDIDDYKIESSLQTEYTLTDVYYRATGLTDERFKNYQIVAGNGNYLLISSNIKDQQATVAPSSTYSCYLLYDIKEDKMTVLENEQTSQYSKACFVDNANELSVYELNYVDEKTYFTKYDLLGNKIETKEVNNTILKSEQEYSISYVDNQILLEVFNAGCAYISLDYKVVGYPYTFKTTQYLGLYDNTIFLAEKENNKITKVTKYSTDLTSILWQCDVNLEKTNGLEKYDFIDYNNDNITDVIGFVNNIDKDGYVISSSFIVIDGSDGKIIKQKKIDIGYDYQANSIKCINSLNKDNYPEILIDDCIVFNGSNLKMVGYVEQMAYYDGTVIDISDGNQDGFDEYVVIDDTTATLYQSTISGFNIYYKEIKHIKLNKEIDNRSYSFHLGDITKDGYDEFVVSNKNSNDYQVFDVIDGKTLEKLYTLCPNGVSGTENYMAIDADFNNDGYNEIFGYTDRYYGYVILNGKDGSLLKFISYEDYEDRIYTYDDDYWHPDYMIGFESYVLEERQLHLINDNQQFVIFKRYYDDNSWVVKTALFVYDSSTFETTDVYVIAQNKYDEYNIKTLNNSKDYFFLSNSSKDYLFDIDKKTIVASFDKIGKEYYVIDDDHIILISNDDVVYLLNSSKGFELLNPIAESSDNYIIEIDLKSLVQYSQFNIYDNGSIVASGNDSHYEIKLAEGQHTITIEMDDLSGKTASEDYYVTITKQKNKTTYLFVLAIIALLASVIASKYRKIYIKKQSKEVK